MSLLTSGRHLMPKLPSPRLARAAAGLAVLSSFAVGPMAAQAADTDATGSLNADSLTNTAGLTTSRCSAARRS